MQAFWWHWKHTWKLGMTRNLQRTSRKLRRTRKSNKRRKLWNRRFSWNLCNNPTNSIKKPRMWNSDREFEKLSRVCRGYVAGMSREPRNLSRIRRGYVARASKITFDQNWTKFEEKNRFLKLLAIVYCFVTFWNKFLIQIELLHFWKIQSIHSNIWKATKNYDLLETLPVVRLQERKNHTNSHPELVPTNSQIRDTSPQHIVKPIGSSTLPMISHYNYHLAVNCNWMNGWKNMCEKLREVNI